MSGWHWPGCEVRASNLKAAVQIAPAEPPPVVRGDLRHDLASLIAQAPKGLWLVVYHSAVPTCRRPPNATPSRIACTKSMPSGSATRCPRCFRSLRRPRRRRRQPISSCLRLTANRSPGPARTGSRSPGLQPETGRSLSRACARPRSSAASLARARRQAGPWYIHVWAWQRHRPWRRARRSPHPS